MVQPLWKIVWQFLKIMNSYHIITSNYTPIPKTIENIYSYRNSSTNVHTAVFTVTKCGNNPNVYQLMNE